MDETKELYEPLIDISLGVPLVIGMCTFNETLFYPMIGLFGVYLLIVRNVLGWNTYYKECE